MKLNIEELAREADEDGLGWLLDESLVDPDDLERFARLIVKRCADVCSDLHFTLGYDAHALKCESAIRNLMED